MPQYKEAAALGAFIVALLLFLWAILRKKEKRRKRYRKRKVYETDADDEYDNDSEKLNPKVVKELKKQEAWLQDDIEEGNLPGAIQRTKKLLQFLVDNTPDVKDWSQWESRQEGSVKTPLYTSKHLVAFSHGVGFAAKANGTKYLFTCKHVLKASEAGTLVPGLFLSKDKKSLVWKTKTAEVSSSFAFSGDLAYCKFPSLKEQIFPITALPTAIASTRISKAMVHVLRTEQKGKVGYSMSGNVVSVSDTKITHTCSTEKGDSGSPLVGLYHGQSLVIGVHYAGGIGENKAHSIVGFRPSLL